MQQNRCSGKLCFLLGSCQGVIWKTVGATESVLYGRLKREGTVGRKLPFRKDLSAEAEKSPLLVAVDRERLVKTQQAGKLSACCGDL
jgi:hypothetical protein